MRCSKCNALFLEIKNDANNIIYCPQNHHKIIQTYSDGSQLEIFEIAELTDGYTKESWSIKVVNSTEFKNKKSMERCYSSKVFLGLHFLFKAERLLPSGSHIFDIPEFDGENFSKVLDLLDANSLSISQVFPEHKFF